MSICSLSTRTVYDMPMHEAGKKYRWQFQDEPNEPNEPNDTPNQQANLHPLVKRLLTQRNLTDPDAIDAFLHPKLTSMHDPALLPGAQAAANRLVKAIADKQHIIVYGDYDVDGITASSILWHTLKALGAQVTCYIPHRIDEGYGLNCQAIEQLTQEHTCPQNNASPLLPMIVSVDCGITAKEPALLAKKLGVDLIITDHHAFSPADLPDAFVIVHPSLEPAYPFAWLCGAGVAFKLAWQVAKTFHASERLPTDMRDLLLDLLSLTALGTVADVMPLIDENRVITTFGLGQIKRTRFVGLNSLIKASRLDEEKISAFHVGFVLGPRLNACGRMGHAREALDLLTETNTTQADQLAQFLTQTNTRRRETEKKIVEQAKQMVSDLGFDDHQNRAIVLAQEDWHPGVLGIVASRLVEAYARPAVMLSIDPKTGVATGSARSVEGVDLHEVIGKQANLLLTHGGHAMAAGLKLKTQNIDTFRQTFVAHVNELLDAHQLIPVIKIDAICKLTDMTLATLDQINQLAPFGRGNPSPVFCMRNLQIDRPPQWVGQQGKHLRLALRQGTAVANAIGFGLGDWGDNLAAGMHVDVVFEPKVSTWRNNRQVDFHIKDIKRIEKLAPV